MPGYEGNTLDDLDPNHPYDTESIGTAAPAIRQIKRVLKNEGEGSITELIKNLIKENMYRVGDYYISDNETNPGDLFGGYWEKIDGKFLVSSGTMEFNADEQKIVTNLPITSWSYWCRTPHIGDIGRSTQTIENNEVVFTFPDSDGSSDPGWEWTQYYDVRMWCTLPEHTPSDINGNAQLQIKVRDTSYMADGGESRFLRPREFYFMFSNNTAWQSSTDSSVYFIGAYTIPIGQTVNINIPVKLIQDYKYFKLCAVQQEWAAEWRLRNVFRISAGTITKTIAGSSDILELEVGDSGGEHLHQLTVDEVPDEATPATIATPATQDIESQIAEVKTPKATESGTVKPHNNMPPYIVTNIWKRTS